MVAPTSSARPTPSTVYISFSAEIIAHTTESLIAAAANCANKGVREVYLLLSTPGGNVMHGMNLYNVLRAMPFKLITHNAGNVDSIGNAVFLAGSERYACPHSTFMYHGVGRDMKAGMRLEEKNAKEALEAILADQKRIGSIIKDRTKLGEREIEGLFREAQTKDAAFAASCGIVDQIKDIQIPSGSTIIVPVFQR
jgi:ATP-dependent Clp protease, protease subunit